MARKRAKLQIQNEGMVTTKSRILEGVEIYVCIVLSVRSLMKDIDGLCG
jgi:hypothetical protein